MSATACSPVRRTLSSAGPQPTFTLSRHRVAVLEVSLPSAPSPPLHIIKYTRTNLPRSQALWLAYPYFNKKELGFFFFFSFFFMVVGIKSRASTCTLLQSQPTKGILKCQGWRLNSQTQRLHQKHRLQEGRFCPVDHGADWYGSDKHFGP